MNSPIILALDTKDLDTAKSWIEATNESIGIYKIGLEFYLKFGAEGLRKLAAAGDFKVFLDLKFLIRFPLRLLALPIYRRSS